MVAAIVQGSGKTLAFAIPIVQSLLHERVRLLRGDAGGQDGNEDGAAALDFGDPQDRAAMAALTSADSGPLRALVLCPTRELAMQVSSILVHAVSICHVSTQVLVPHQLVKDIRECRLEPCSLGGETSGNKVHRSFIPKLGSERRALSVSCRYDT